MECYICSKVVKSHKYPNHVRSHLAGNVTGMHPRLDPSLASLCNDTVNYNHHGTVLPAHSTPPRIRARAPPQQEYPLRPVTPNDELQSSDLEDISAHLPPDTCRQPSPSPSLSPIHAALVPDYTPKQNAPEGRSVQPNAFHMWLRNPMHYSPKYTTIDGQKSKSDSQLQLRQIAEILRRTTREEVIKIVEEFKGFSSAGNDKETCLELTQKVPIFPGLVAYTYTHLSVCPRRGWLSKDDWSGRVFELKQLVENRSKSGDIQCVLACNSMKRRLLRILSLTSVRPGEHKCNSALLNGTLILDHDVRNLAAVMALSITGSQKEDILDQCGAQAEELVETFHDLLEANVQLDEGYRRSFLNPLIQFTKEFGYCPRGIYLKEGQVDGLVLESGGGFGMVYKGRLDSRLVAVKALKRDGQSLPEYNKQVSKEAVVWRHLRHPNCLPLYGVYRMPTEGPNISIALVSPWMDQGTISEYLQCNPGAKRTQLILDVVRGLDYLHSMQPHVAHRDVKPDNILVTSKGRACLADFGLVSMFDTDDGLHTAPSQIVMCGTYHYMAPEIFNAENKEDIRKVNKRACDMYALGCTIYAVYTGRPPFDGLNPMRIRVNLMDNQRPEFPKDSIPLDMWSFVENLWGQDPSRRLTAGVALGWMEIKARQEGVDLNLAPLEEEWEWRGPHDDECLWSVPV